MNMSLSAVSAGIGLLLLAACGSESKPAASPAQPPPPNPAEQSARAPQQPAAPPARSLTITAVHVEPTIMSTCNIPPPKTYFEFDSAQLREQADTTLTAVAQCLSSGPLKGHPITVTGHADPRGTDEYNMQLGKSRAESVSEYLSGSGLDKGKINVVSKGEQEASENDPSGWPYDRRVDIRLTK